MREWERRQQIGREGNKLGDERSREVRTEGRTREEEKRRG
jgi:hypothetical protein